MGRSRHDISYRNRVARRGRRPASGRFERRRRERRARQSAERAQGRTEHPGGGGSALDAAQASVVELEECPWFNAGRGAVFTDKGDHEMDAAIMSGDHREAGAVAGIHFARNPIKAARAVLEHSDHVLLSGVGADQFVAAQALEQVDNAWFDTELRRRQWQAQRLSPQTLSLEPGGIEKKFGTVGAVALDTQRPGGRSDIHRRHYQQALRTHR
ncbi:isoaspartyl peptidase/L-asparaginase [Pseudomonas sp. RTB3]|nr:isoaspartyl peptidase/L-asparaginase [Pseudomonas sp. RTB3]